MNIYKTFYYITNINFIYILVYSKAIVEDHHFKPLKLKDSGIQIKKCQEKLNSLNYNCGIVDGYFRPLTEKCVQEFQRVNGLNVTGEIEEQTYDRLFSNDAINNINTLHKNINTTTSISYDDNNISNSFVNNFNNNHKNSTSISYDYENISKENGTSDTYDDEDISNDSINNIHKNITFVSFDNDNNYSQCSLKGIKDSISDTKITYEKKRRDNDFNTGVGVNAEVNVNELLTQLFNLVGYTFDGKKEATMNSPNGNDLEICYIDDNVVISCYCHETSKHYALSYGRGIKTGYKDPGEIACSKELRSFILFRSYDHCYSGIYDEQSDAIKYIEKQKKSLKSTRAWMWVVFIIVAIVVSIFLCFCFLVFITIKYSNNDD